MEVILNKDIENLGKKDELVIVKNGYGRNYLIPQGFAKLAHASLKKMHAETLKQRAFKEEKLKEEAEKLVAKLKDMKIKIGAKVGEKGKIFGSINAIQVSDAIAALGFKVDRKDIAIKEEPIKHVGVYEAEVKFYNNVKETIKFEVVGE